MRKLYSIRRDILRSLISEQLPSYLQEVSSDGGMHCVYYLKHALSDIEICDQAAKQGLAIRPLSSYYSQKMIKQGLVIGFAGFSESEQVKAVSILKHIMVNDIQ